MRAVPILFFLMLAVLAPLRSEAPAQETSQACDSPTEPFSVPASTDGAYRGPLFDTHLHLSVMRRFGSAAALCAWLERRQVLGAIGFLPVAPGRAPEALTPVLSAGQSRVIFLLRPTNAASFVEFALGAYTADMVRAFLVPQGVFRGAGEVSLHQPGMEAVGFDSPPMHTLYRAINEMRGVIMMHPRGDRVRGNPSRVHDPMELEPILRQYPDITFLFHGGPSIFDPFVAPLMARHPNVYFTFDATLWLFSVPVRSGNLLGHFDPSASAQKFFAGVGAAGGIDQIVELALPLAVPRIRRFADRVMWGTDLVLEWHFDDKVADTVILASRRFIHRLPADLQEAYAFRNARRVFEGQLLQAR